MQSRKSVEPIKHKKEHVLSKHNVLDSDYPKIRQQSPSLNEKNCDMRMKEYVDEKIISKGED